MKIGVFEIDEEAKRIVLDTIVLPFVAPSIGGHTDADRTIEVEGEILEIPEEYLTPFHWGCAIPVVGTRLYMHLEISLETGLADASASYNIPSSSESKDPDIFIRGEELAAIDTLKLFDLFGPRGADRGWRAAQLIEESGWEQLEVKQGTPKEIEELYRLLETRKVKLL